jgi:HSP20 family protein
MTDHGGSPFLDFQRQVEEAFDKLIYRRWAIPAPAAWRPRLDLYDTRDAYVIEVDLSGVPPERVEIRLAGRELTIAGTRAATDLEGALVSHRERECGSFRRSLTLPHAIAPERAQAEYRHGTIRIRPIKERPHEPAAQEAIVSDAGAGRSIRITIS